MAEEFVQTLPHSQKRIDFHLPGNGINWLTGLQENLAERAALHCSWCEHHAEGPHSSDQILVLLDLPNLENGVKCAGVAILGLSSQGSRWEGILQLCG